MVKVDKGAKSSISPATSMYAPVTKATMAGFEPLRAARENVLVLTGWALAFFVFLVPRRFFCSRDGGYTMKSVQPSRQRRSPDRVQCAKTNQFISPPLLKNINLLLY